MSSSVFIPSKRLVLRQPEESDAEEIAAYYRRNESFLKPFEPLRPPAFVTAEFWVGQVRQYRRDYDEDRALRLVITPAGHEQSVIGFVSFTGITRGAAWFCYLGYSLDEQQQGKGYMTEALRAATVHAFRELKLHRIMANYMPHNTRSGKLLKRLGFMVEGYAREYLMINGEWEDHILTSLTYPEWEP